MRASAYSQIHVLRAVRHQEGDAVAAPTPALLQSADQPIGPRAEFGVAERDVSSAVTAMRSPPCSARAIVEFRDRHAMAVSPRPSSQPRMWNIMR
jgi:hypothetical protein